MLYASQNAKTLSVKLLLILSTILIKCNAYVKRSNKLYIINKLLVKYIILVIPMYIVGIRLYLIITHKNYEIIHRDISVYCIKFNNNVKNLRKKSYLMNNSIIYFR